MNIHISKKSLCLRPILVFLFVLFLALVMELPMADTLKLSLVKNAEAIVGRPLIPVSVGGVRRRTRRRTAVVVGTTAAASTAAAATAARVAVGTRVYALPGGCQKAIVGGVNYYRCNGVYYRPYYEGSTLVYVVENP